MYELSAGKLRWRMRLAMLVLILLAGIALDLHHTLNLASVH